MRIITPALLAVDSYKLAHADMYPEGMNLLFSTWTPRSDKIAKATGRQIDDDGRNVFFGVTRALRDLQAYWDDSFFNVPLDAVLNEYNAFLTRFLGAPASEATIERITDLHDIGYLPLIVRYLPEGTVTNTRVVQLAIFNSHPMHGWLVNYIETQLSILLWKAQTAATIARNYYKEARTWAELTCDNLDHLPWQIHDFSLRGHDGFGPAEDAQVAHLLYFGGTDTIPAIFALNNNYEETENVLYGSVPATEHSVMCAGGELSEKDTFERLLSIYPSGILSVVSDTWDLWHVLTHILPDLRDNILERNGKLVIRPDSGDPIDILCGNPNADPASPEYAGVVELLWNIFGGEVNQKGYKVLDPHIGTIYGDSITLPRAHEIFKRLQAKGFASSNVVLGIGSYTYQCNTRDTYGFAMKATGAIIDGEERALFKDPITDDGIKRSFKGFLDTIQDGRGDFITIDGLPFSQKLPENSAFVQQHLGDIISLPKWADVVARAHAGL